MIWFGLVVRHIKHCRLFNAKSSLYIYSSKHKNQNDIKKKSKCEITFLF